MFTIYNNNLSRFLRRLEKSIKKRENQKSPSESCHEDGSDGHDSPGVTSPLLRSPVKSNAAGKLSGSRQKRLANFYGNSIPWRSRERDPIHGGDINSD